jgi:hypothetical protein
LQPARRRVAVAAREMLDPSAVPAIEHSSGRSFLVFSVVREEE